MPRIEETAYRQRKRNAHGSGVARALHANPDERLLAQEHTTGGTPALVAFLVLLKTFQHLGYADALASVPMSIVSHIANQIECQVTGQDLINYDRSGTRRRHLQVIRTHLQIVASGEAMRDAGTDNARGVREQR